MDKKVDNKINKEILFFWCLVLILLIILSIVTLVRAFAPGEEKVINYKETSDIRYKVYLKPNEFYENEYLEENMLYVASLIDKINIDFDYKFSLDEIGDMEFDYTIYGTLLVADEAGTNKYYEKSYTLLPTKTVNLNSQKELNINETLDVDYNYYNDIVNDFRSEYGLDINSKLDIYMLITKKNSNELVVMPDKINKYMTFSIPLSKKSVNVKMDFKELEESSHVIKEPNSIIRNRILFVIAILSIFSAIVATAKIVGMIRQYINRKGKFYKHINKILKEYDRLIAETTTIPDTNNYNVIKIEKFLELVDVRDNLSIPIMYTLKEKEAYFYIIYHETLYIYTINEEDFKENK